MACDVPKTTGIMPKIMKPLSLTPEELLERRRKAREVHWYALRVSAQHERKLVEQLKEKDFEAFVPVRQEKHRWSDRMKMVEQVLTPQIIFIRTCMEKKNEVFISREIKSFVYAPGENNPAPIPDAKMADFIRLIDANYNFKMTLPLLGDDVMVLDGPLRGLVGNLVKIDGENQLIIRLNDAFGAQITIDPMSVSKVPKGTLSIPAEQVPNRV